MTEYWSDGNYRALEMRLPLGGRAAVAVSVKP